MSRQKNLPTELSRRLDRHEHQTRTEWEATPAAVLVPFYWHDEEWHLLFTRRTQTVNSHQGQVSFPGGAIEEDDASPEQAALREAWEEVGLPVDRTKVLGRLDSLLTVTQFHVTPVVATIPWPFELKLNRVEVAAVFGVPLPWLLDPANLERRLRESSLPSERPIPVYYFEPYQGEVIWGVTAHIIVNLLDHLRPLIN